jgi:hypothetical protein
LHATVNITTTKVPVWVQVKVEEVIKIVVIRLSGVEILTNTILLTSQLLMSEVFLVVTLSSSEKDRHFGGTVTVHYK